MAINFLSDQLFPSDIFLVDVSLGRIGVNTLVPRTALEVVGTIRVWSGSNTHTYVETSSGSNLGSIQGKKNSDNAVKSLALNPLGGNVGINLGAGIIPSENLQVQGSAKIQADSNNFLKITTSQAATTFANSGNGFVSPNILFNTGTNTRLTILGSNGNVGIGTTSPGVRLTTNTQTPSDSPTLGSGTVGGQALLASNGAYGQYSGVSNLGHVWHQVQRNDANTAAYPMIFQPAGGLVGIGTIAPISNGGAAAGLLHINGGNTWAATHYTNTSTGAGTSDGGVIAQVATDLEIFNYEAGEIRLSTNSSRAITIDSSQNVGIGTTSPRAKLDVAGGVKVADDTDGAALNKVGTLRYRYVPGSPKNFSYVDMCMQTGGSSYAWVNIVQNVWN